MSYINITRRIATVLALTIMATSLMILSPPAVQEASANDQGQWYSNCYYFINHGTGQYTTHGCFLPSNWRYYFVYYGEGNLPDGWLYYTGSISYDFYAWLYKASDGTWWRVADFPNTNVTRCNAYALFLRMYLHAYYPSYVPEPNDQQLNPARGYSC